MISPTYSVEHQEYACFTWARSTGRTGCICPESAPVKGSGHAFILRSNDLLIVDMDAGLEHLGRATAGRLDHLLIVVEPGRRSLDTAKQIARLARDIGIRQMSMIANKVRTADDRQFIEQNRGNLPLLGVLSLPLPVIEADQDGAAVCDTVPQLAHRSRRLPARSTGSKATEGDLLRLRRACF